MEKTEVKNCRKLLQSIIKTRVFLIKTNCNGKPIAKCNEFIKYLQVHIEAYGNKWDAKGWISFIQRNHSKIDFLIPENKAGETTRLKIIQLIQNV